MLLPIEDGLLLSAKDDILGLRVIAVSLHLLKILTFCGVFRTIKCLYNCRKDVPPKFLLGVYHFLSNNEVSGSVYQVIDGLIENTIFAPTSLAPMHERVLYPRRNDPRFNLEQSFSSAGFLSRQLWYLGQ